MRQLASVKCVTGAARLLPRLRICTPSWTCVGSANATSCSDLAALHKNTKAVYAEYVTSHSETTEQTGSKKWLVRYKLRTSHPPTQQQYLR